MKRKEGGSAEITNTEVFLDERVIRPVPFMKI
jgi:hypothetical protein